MLPHLPERYIDPADRLSFLLVLPRKKFGGFSSNPGMAFIYRGLQDSEKDSMFEEMMKAGRRRLGAREEGDRKMYMSITSCLITLEK